MALGHWAKSYLSEGKANNGGGSGGDGGVLIVPLDVQAANAPTFRSTKTVREVLDAPAVRFDAVRSGGGTSVTMRLPLLSTVFAEGMYQFVLGYSEDNSALELVTLTATSLDDYPKTANWTDDESGS